MSNIVYHYCSVSTFLNIIQSKTLRFYDIDKSNDFLERKLLCQRLINKGINPFLEILKETSKNSNKSLLAIKNTEKLTAIKNSVTNKIKNSKAYVICFSEEGDLLNQWRGYADDGQGLAIGFNDDVFRVLSVGQKSIFGYDKIQYIPRTEINKFKNLSISSEDIEYKSVFAKNEAFAEEKEWRAVIYNRLNNNFSFVNLLNSMNQSEDNALQFKPLQFSSNGKEIKSFIEVNFDKMKTIFVKDIYIGPKCKVEIRDIELLLDTYGYKKENIRIERSIASYR